MCWVARCGKGKSDVFWVYYVSGVTDALAAATATHRCDCDLVSRARARAAAPLRLVSGALSFVHLLYYIA